MNNDVSDDAQRVLAALYRLGGAGSATGLVAATGLTHSQIHQATRYLQAEHWLDQDSIGGRIVFRLNRQKRRNYAASID